MPGISIQSAGLDATQGTEIPSNVRVIAREWELGTLKNHADSVTNKIEEILAADLVVLAEKNHNQFLRKIGYKNDFFSINDSILDESFAAVDPYGFKLSELKIEIAKIVIGALRFATYSLKYLHLPNILTVIPNSPSDTGIAYSHACFEKSIRNSALIDLDLRSPGAKEFTQNFSVVEYDPMSLTPFDLIDATKNTVFTPYKEFSIPEKHLISQNLRDKIRELSQEIPVIQISAPRVTSLATLPDSILAACDSVRISRVLV
jgi:protein-tyrosine-phosphatase